MSEADIAGWHGKLPTVGDFATRRLDGDFVSAWDDWLSHGLAELRLRSGWLDAYLASPSWRFLLMRGALPGALGERHWAGVLMPSVDRVGRYYPLTLAQPLNELPSHGEGIEALWSWLLRLDEAAADALQDDWDIDALEAELARLGSPELAEVLPAAASALPDLPTQSLPLAGHRHAGALLAAQAFTLWRDRHHGCAFWYCETDLAAPRLLCSAGLDRTRLVSELFGAVGAGNALGDNPDPLAALVGT